VSQNEYGNDKTGINCQNGMSIIYCPYFSLNVDRSLVQQLISVDKCCTAENERGS